MEVEINMSPTSSFSSWHLDLMRKYNKSFAISDDMCYFIKIDNDIYRVKSNIDELYKYISNLETLNNDGIKSDEETLALIEDLVNNRNPQFKLEKCINLNAFEEQLKVIDLEK